MQSKEKNGTRHDSTVWATIKSPARAVALVIGLTPTSSVLASELLLHLGGLYGGEHTESTYSWALEYRRPLGDHFLASFTWLNEGHIRDHHRDGQSAQLWWHTMPSRRGLRFEAGLGPYYYFDTVTSSDHASGYANSHGWGLLGSMGASWYFGKGLVTSLRLNRVQVPNGINSTALVAGLGYRFGPVGGSIFETQTPPANGAGAKQWEVDVMLGKTIVNSFDSESDVAKGIALRWRANRNIALSLAYLDEGTLDEDGVHAGRRRGLSPQVWLEEDLTERFSVGVGLGPHFATRKPQPGDKHAGASTVSALLSVSAAYAITSAWSGRLTWNRMTTNYDRDSDIVMFALGYRF